MNVSLWHAPWLCARERGRERGMKEGEILNDGLATVQDTTSVWMSRRQASRGGSVGERRNSIRLTISALPCFTA